MRVALNNVWLTNDGVSDLHAWTDAHSVSLNGRQVVQEAQFLRAVAGELLARGNLVNELRFTVTRQHASVAEAASFLLGAFSSLPTEGLATVVCGAPGETAVTCTLAAVLAEMPSSTFRGTRTDTVFVLRGGAVSVLTSTVTTTVDGGAFNTAYSYAAGGSLDGGNLADALVPVSLDFDGGAF
jgi:hypothetical protein